MTFDPTVLGSLMDRYGLPIAILAGLMWALFTRRLVLGSENERSTAAYTKELEYREARRTEERADKVLADQALRENNATLVKLSDAVDVLSDAVDALSEERRARR